MNISCDISSDALFKTNSKNSQIVVKQNEVKIPKNIDRNKIYGLLNNQKGFIQKPGLFRAAIGPDLIHYEIENTMLSADDLIFKIFTHPIAYSLFMMGDFILHGSAVKFGGKVYLFVGPSGVGKSYLAGKFLDTGELISEDILRINFFKNSAYVYSSLPIIKLSDNFFNSNTIDFKYKFKLQGDNRERRAYVLNNFDHNGYSCIDTCYFVTDGRVEELKEINNIDTFKLLLYSSIAAIPRNKCVVSEERLIKNMEFFINNVQVKHYVNSKDNVNKLLIENIRDVKQK